MPITLECYCPDDLNIAACTVTKLTLHIELTTAKIGATGALVEVGYGWDGARFGGVAALDANGTVVQDINLPVAVADTWGTFYVGFGGGHSINQGPDAGTVYKAKWYVTIEYTCSNSATGDVKKYEVRTINQQGGVDDCSGNGSMVSSVGRGAGIYQIWWSRSLALDQDAWVEGTDWQPVPIPNAVSVGTSSELCLCPSGLTPPYEFSVVSGALPSGRTLNPATGCVTGAPDGKDQGSFPITYRVVDSTGAYAEVTCDYVGEGCPPCEEAGNNLY